MLSKIPWKIKNTVEKQEYNKKQKNNVKQNTEKQKVCKKQKHLKNVKQ